MRREDRRGALQRAPEMGGRGRPPLREERKRIRLAREVYGVPGNRFLLTLCTAARRPIFADPRLACEVFASLRNGPVFHEADVLAACLMPDHLHLLLSVKDANLVDIVNRWKTYSTNLLHKMGVGGPVWQRSFYDHGLRRGEDVAAAAEYVVNNPVRKGLVDKPEDYPCAWHVWAAGGEIGRPPFEFLRAGRGPPLE
jgi:putative transposase